MNDSKMIRWTGIAIALNDFTVAAFSIAGRDLDEWFMLLVPLYFCT